MRLICVCSILLIALACRPAKEDADYSVPNPLKDEPSHSASEQVEELVDRTEQIYDEIKDLFSGSWMFPYASIDGEREVSWGTVPFSNQSYFIIDFQYNNKIIIRGSTEGGKKGFDSYIAEVLKIDEEDTGMYRFIYDDILSTFKPNKEHSIVLRYNAENDTMAIIGYGDNNYENPSEMIRISEPLHEQ